MIPCRHAMAVYRLHKGNDLMFVQSELVVGDYHKFGSVKKTLKQNIFPVSTDSLKSDGTTLPPIVKKRGAGCPKTKRIRHRSEYQMGEDSPIICSNCGCRGHNKRTCPNPQKPAKSLPSCGKEDKDKDNEEDQHEGEIKTNEEGGKVNADNMMEEEKQEGQEEDHNNNFSKDKDDKEGQDEVGAGQNS